MADLKSRFEALAPAYLEVQLPKAQDFDAAALLRAGTPEELARTPGRRNLFFDEEANILVVLKTAQSEDELGKLLPSLELVLSAHATDAVPQGAGNAASASGKHDLVSKTFLGSTFVDLVTVGDNAYVVWKPTLPLSRPRARLQRPAIYFTATLKLQRNSIRASKGDQEVLLKSYEPLPDNVLEPFRHDPALRDSNVYLSETRITKVAPKPSNVEDTVKPIRGASKRAYPTVPALFTKMRFSTMPEATIASLHLETSQLIAGSVRITDVTLTAENSNLDDLTKIPLPLPTRGGDETIFLYSIPPSRNVAGKAEDDCPPPVVSVSIKADAALDQGSHINLNISWQMDADVTSSVAKPIYIWSKPLKASSHHKSLSVQSIGKPVSQDLGSRHGESESGVVFTFECPETVQSNRDFKMRVKCLNRSERQRRFALVVLQPRKPLATTLLPGVTDKESDLVAKVFKAPPLARNKTPDVLDLNPDVRIGPLPPGACFETHIEFRATKAGVLDLGPLRIIDLESRQIVDVRELPDVIALDELSHA